MTYLEAKSLYLVNTPRDICPYMDLMPISTGVELLTSGDICRIINK